MSGDVGERPTRDCSRGTHGLVLATATTPFVYTVVATNLWIWFVVGSVFGIGVTPYFYDQQRILQLVVLLAVVLIVAIDRRVRAGVLQAFTGLPMATRAGISAFFALGVMSAARAPLRTAAFREVGMFVLLTVLCFIVVAARQQAATLFDLWALRLLVVAAATYSLVFAIMDLVVDRGSMMIGFDNPRSFGQVGLWLFPLLVTAALRRTRRPAFRLGRWVTVIAWWALIVEGGGRSAMYGSLLGAAVTPFVVGRAGREWTRATVCVVFAGTTLWFTWVSAFGHGTGGLLRAVDKGGDASGRFDMWADTIELIAARPVLGVGPEHYAYHDTHLASPHNVPLQIAAEWGLPAALILAALVIWGAFRWVVRQPRHMVAQSAGDPAGVNLAAGLTATIVAAGFASLLEGTISGASSQMLLSGLVAWVLAVYFRNRPAPVRAPRRSGQAVLVAAVLVAAGAVTAGALPYALHPGERVDTYLEDRPETRLAPRFWVQGRLTE